MSLPFNIRADMTLSYFVIIFFNYFQGPHVLPFSVHCHLQKFISPQPWGSMWCATYHRKQHDVYYPFMGVVYACAFSFMSKYLYQSCGPKPMTRVDINDNNQSSNNLPLFHWWQHSCVPYHHDPNFSPPLTSMARGMASPPEFNGKR